MKKRTDGILINLDGTLIDSIDAHAKAWFEALREVGISKSLSEIRNLIGLGEDDLIALLAKVKKDSKLGRQVESRRAEIFRLVYLPAIKAFPASQQLLEEFKKLKLKIVVLSAGPKEELKMLLRQANLESLQDHIVCAADVVHAKPSPDIVEAALGLVKLGPRATILLGSTPYDIEAAKSAGVRTVAFTCGGWGREAFKDSDYVFASPYDMLRALQQDQAEPFIHDGARQSP